MAPHINTITIIAEQSEISVRELVQTFRLVFVALINDTLYLLRHFMQPVELPGFVRFL